MHLRLNLLYCNSVSATAKSKEKFVYDGRTFTYDACDRLGSCSKEGSATGRYFLIAAVDRDDFRRRWHKDLTDDEYSQRADGWHR